MSRPTKIVRPARIDRESGNRMAARNQLRNGGWDDMPSSMRSSTLRRPSFTQ